MTDKEKLVELGYEDVVVFDNFSYDGALIGITHDNRAVYDFDLMVRYLIEVEEFEDEIEAIEWIEYNTLRSLPYAGNDAPIVVNMIRGV